MKRRELLRGMAAVGATGAAEIALAAQPASPPSRPAVEDPSVVAHLNTGLLRLPQGHIAGYQRNGVFTYKGIPYAASTAGTARFMAPLPAESWDGVRSSRAWGPVCPQLSRGDGRHNDQETFMFDWADYTGRVYGAAESEECLRLNVWTPGVADGKRRPVLFWIHGGGFANGSAHEQPSYDGENLARRGDAVVVSVNHRLNVFGYLDLSAYGELYRHSGNAGMLDLVAALAWVRDNIHLFGGDPGCVTIFGQSGGGAKVCALMAMPPAKGLFHRAIAESGSMLRAQVPERSRALASEILTALQINRDSISKLHDLPYQTLLKETSLVLQQQNTKAAADRLGFGPVFDGEVLAEQPFDGRATSISADVPLIVGSTLNEFTSATNEPALTAISEAELEQKVKAAHPDRANEILRVYRTTMSQSTPWQRWQQIASVPNREGAIAQCTAKAALGRAPAYLYWFVWQTPILDATPGAFHCSEIAFVFDNTDRCDTMTGGGARPRALAGVVSEAWLHFARTGNPNHPGMPLWKPFTAANGEVMIFDDQSHLALNPDAAQRRSVTGHA